jgi:hypothetical protein
LTHEEVHPFWRHDIQQNDSKKKQLGKWHSAKDTPQNDTQPNDTRQIDIQQNSKKSDCAS